MIRDFQYKVYGRGVVCANLHGQRGIPYLSEEELWALRDAEAQTDRQIRSRHFLGGEVHSA